MSRLSLRPALRRYAHSVQRRAAAPAFVGAYDAIPDIVAAYGMRRLLSAYEGPILRLRRDSDQTEQDFGYTDNGDLDVAAIAAWLSGANGLITTWYDQSGNANHAVQTTAARQPLYVASGQNGRPVAQGDGTERRLNIPRGQPVREILAVWDPAETGEHEPLIGNGSSTGLAIFADSDVGTDGTRLISVGGWTATIGKIRINDGAYGASSRLHQGADLYPDTAFLLGVQYEEAHTTFDYLMHARTGGTSFPFLAGDIAEVLLADDVWSEDDWAVARTAANAYWSVY